MDTYDLVITVGRVMDPETGFEGVANVGVVDGKIVKITTNTISGEKTIDAKGPVVAPGFIDGHIHFVDMPFGRKMSIRDGLTTARALTRQPSKNRERR